MLSTRKKDWKGNAPRPRRSDPVVRSSHELILPQMGKRDETPVENDSWDEMVFEHRNRDYGAYVVRQGYTKNVVIGLIASFLTVGLVLIYPRLQKLIQGEQETSVTPPRKLVYTELSAPPPIDKPKPPPPSVQLPRLKKVIKFVPPRIVKEQVTDFSPTLAEIRTNDIGAETVDSPSDVIFDEPADGVVGSADDEIFTVVDQQPEYAGGYEAMMAFIKQNMQYPPRARQLQIEGTVHVSFIVSKTGEISDVRILRGIMADCDREAVRVVSMMPRWNPGKQNGHPVNVRFILPLKFRLN